jgi:FAD:protein FMN transferase
MKPTPTNQSHRRAFIGASLGAGLLVGFGALKGTRTLQWQERAMHGFGTTLWLRAAHHDAAALERGLEEAIAGIRAIETQMSLFDLESDITTLNRDGLLKNPGLHLLAALTLGKSIAQASNGAFDPTVQSFWPLWANSKLSGRIPTRAALEEAKLLVDWRGIQIKVNEIRFDRPGMHGVENALINTGEWSAMGHSQAGKPWSLGMADPHLVNKVLMDIVADGDSVATSADNTIVFTADRRYHHVLDSKTGVSPPHMSMVTVIAPSCALADALTKVFFMQEFDQAQVTARQWGVKAILVDKAGIMKVVA